MTENLNPQQKEALLEITRPVLILAGAGSGKTRVITHKIAHLIKEHGYAPWSVFAVTFTNKAAKEMRERLLHILSPDTDQSQTPYSPHNFWISTFHSACGRILRRDIERLGYKNNFSVYDSDDSSRLIKSILKVGNFDKITENVYSISSQISWSKNHFETPDALISRAIEEGDEFLNQVGQVYKRYEKELFDSNALDFDNIILKTITLLETQKDILERYQKLFQYILVDEFQDTNESQYRLIKLLSGGRNSISVVGDDDQSIYSWRGANISNIIGFGSDYKDCLTVKLEQNYRSTNTILRAANSVVQKNKNRLNKELWSDKGDGDNIKYYSAKSEYQEGNWLIAEILNLFERGIHAKDIAIFYRMNYQSRILEEMLRKENIPYRIFGGIKFYDRMEIKDLLAYLTLLINDRDNIAMKRVINVPKRGIGNTSIKKIDVIATEMDCGFKQSAKHCIETGMIRNPAKTKLAGFFALLDDLQQAKETMSVSEILDYIIDKTTYLEHLEQHHDNFDDREENIKELKRAISHYESEQIEPTLDHFLMEIALQSAIDDLDEEENYVNLMTLHNSKGLEFDNVFISGLDEGVFPHYRALDSVEDMEEERRLFYVGLTRSRLRCFLSSATQRFQYGQYKYYTQSRFISEINNKYIDKEGDLQSESDELQEVIEAFEIKKEDLKSKAVSRRSQKDYITNPKDIKLGDELRHDKFGLGKVLKVNDKGSMSTVLMEFEDGNRLLILQYAYLYR